MEKPAVVPDRRIGRTGLDRRVEIVSRLCELALTESNDCAQAQGSSCGVLLREHRVQVGDRRVPLLHSDVRDGSVVQDLGIARKTAQRASEVLDCCIVEHSTDVGPPPQRVDFAVGRVDLCGGSEIGGRTHRLLELHEDAGSLLVGFHERRIELDCPVEVSQGLVPLLPRHGDYAAVQMSRGIGGLRRENLCEQRLSLFSVPQEDVCPCLQYGPFEVRGIVDLVPGERGERFLRAAGLEIDEDLFFDDRGITLPELFGSRVIVERILIFLQFHPHPGARHVDIGALRLQPSQGVEIAQRFLGLALPKEHVRTLHESHGRVGLIVQRPRVFVRGPRQEAPSLVNHPFEYVRTRQPWLSQQRPFQRSGSLL